MAGPVITQRVDSAPCPRVEVYFASFASGTASATILRLAGGRQFEVRGAVRAATAGGLVREDFEVPFNIPVTYRAEMFDSSGISLGFTDSTTVTVASVDTWMHNPLMPAGSSRVVLMDTAAKRISRPVPGRISYPLGRRVGVVMSEPRRGVSGVVMDVYAASTEEADKIQAFLGDYTSSAVPVICIRTGSGNPMRVPQPLFLGVLDIPEEDVDIYDGGEATIQRIAGDEVAPPVPGLFVPLLRRKDIDAHYATRAAVRSGNLTRISVSRRNDLAGFAG